MMPGSPDHGPNTSSRHGHNDNGYLVESASQEIFSGPVSESVPSSYSTFHHRRQFSARSGLEDLLHDRESASRSPEFRVRRSSSLRRRPQFDTTESDASFDSQSSNSHASLMRKRTDSLSSFRFFSQDEIQQAEGASSAPNEVDPVEYELSRREDIQDEEYLPRTPHQHPKRYSYEQNFRPPEGFEEEITDISLESSSRKRQQSIDNLHRWDTVESEEPLLSHIASRLSEDLNYTSYHKEYDSSRFQQRFYISEEDLVIVIAGYRTGRLRKLLYEGLCIATLGIAYLVLRWFPRWRIACTGVPSPLGKCEWLVVENQRGELVILDISSARYNRPLSTIFREDETEKSAATDSNPEVSTSNGMNLNGEVEDEDEEDECIDKDPVIPTLRTFEYRYIRFFYHPLQDIFLTNFDWVDPRWVDVQTVREGIDNDTQKDRIRVFGPNIIDINEKTTLQLLFDEILHPFYIFQVFSIILWGFDEYYYYASCIFIISVFSVGNTLIETKQTLSRMRDLARFECDVRALRSGFWTAIRSSELVPGDIYEVSDPSITLFPCDSILLSGDCVINESMLTGESVPVSKLPATDEALQHLVSTPSRGSTISPELSKHFLYSGTKIVQVRRPQALNTGPNAGSQLDVAVAMVARTAFNTTKGALVRSMLFPKPSGFKFYQDSFKYISAMAFIALIGFSFSTVGFIRMHLDTKLIILRALDLVTVVVPPALPATLTIGTNISLSRLRNKLIYCISPSRINVGGKLDVVCFDKTGTLTEDGLDVLGIHVIERSTTSKRKFSDLFHSIHNFFPTALSLDGQDINDRMRSAFVAMLTTCHSLRSINNELVGDPLDLKMFEYTGWMLDEDCGASLFPNDNTIANPVSVTFPADSRFHLGIMHSFEFVPKIRRMSVLVKSSTSDTIHVFVKGAPEVMPEICIPSTFPLDYDKKLHYYTHRGYRVIACATKTYENLTSEEARKFKRPEVESGLTLMGFIVFENKLKPTTTAVIEQLNDAEIRTVMCTGDNVLTAISVARECKIVQDSMIFVPNFLGKQDQQLRSKLTCQNLKQSIFNGRVLMTVATYWTQLLSRYELLGNYFI